MAVTPAPVAIAPAHPALKRRVRAVLSWLHLWVGLGVGTFFVVVGLSGSVLVFHNDLLRWQHPELTAYEPRVDGQVLASLLEHETPRGMGSIQMPSEALPVWLGFYKDGHRAYFSPGDGALLLTRSEHDDALMWLHELHTELLAGPMGEEILGVIGWIACGLLLTGLYLWWPKRGRMLAQLRMYQGPPVRRWLTWHRTSGVVLLPLLLLATLTGVGMVYHKGARTLLTTAFGGAAIPDAPTHVTGTEADWPHAIERARAALPGASLSRTGSVKEGVISFRLRMPGEWHPYGRSGVHVDASGRDVLLTYDATRQPLGSRMTEAIYPLHIGSVGGTAMKWATALAGLLPIFLLVTGFLFWRRRGRR